MRSIAIVAAVAWMLGCGGAHRAPPTRAQPKASAPFEVAWRREIPNSYAWGVAAARDGRIVVVGEGVRASGCRSGAMIHFLDAKSQPDAFCDRPALLIGATFLDSGSLLVSGYRERLDVPPTLRMDGAFFEEIDREGARRVEHTFDDGTGIAYGVQATTDGWFVHGILQGGATTFGDDEAPRRRRGSFVARYDAAGKHRWHVLVEGRSAGPATSFDADARGRSVVAGSFWFEKTLPNKVLLVSRGVGFVASFDEDGHERWRRDTKGDAALWTVAMGPNGDVYAAGTAKGKLDWGGHPFEVDGRFLTHFDGNGVPLWTRADRGGRPFGLVLDRHGDVVVACSESALTLERWTPHGTRASAVWTVAGSSGLSGRSMLAAQETLLVLANRDRETESAAVVLGLRSR